jgi:hypothetical protein
MGDGRPKPVWMGSGRLDGTCRVEGVFDCGEGVYERLLEGY